MKEVDFELNKLLVITNLISSDIRHLGEFLSSSSFSSSSIHSQCVEPLEVVNMGTVVHDIISKNPTLT